jgi:hypothetical protein
MQTESLVLCCYGVEVRLVDDAGLWLCQRLRETLPPEFAAPSGPPQVSVVYVVTAVVPPGLTEASEFLITCDEVAVFATAVDEEVFWWLRRDIDQAVARRCTQLVFVHAGVVGWRGVGIVIPGRASIGKSTLVVELVRRGAVYYSDAFAALDDAGRVHPYRGMIGLDGESRPRNLRLVREDGATDPLPIKLITAGAYTPGVVWRPAVVRGSHAALSLVESSVLAREVAPRLPRIAAQVAADAVALRGPRSEAAEVAALLLDTVDDALVSLALGPAEDNRGRLADELARVAEIRLRSPHSRPMSPPRRLVAARYVRKLDVLPPADHRRLLQYVLSGESEVWESRVVGAEQSGNTRDEIRQSPTQSSERHDEIWDILDRRVQAMLPFVRQELEIRWFPRGRIEWQLTAHGQGGDFVPRVDADTAGAPGRRISCVYYFHQAPKPFSGGELKLAPCAPEHIPPSSRSTIASCSFPAMRFTRFARSIPRPMPSPIAVSPSRSGSGRQGRRLGTAISRAAWSTPTRTAGVACLMTWRASPTPNHRCRCLLAEANRGARRTPGDWWPSWSQHTDSRCPGTTRSRYGTSVHTSASLTDT